VTTLQAFADEMSKIAASAPAQRLNKTFGLPLKKGKPSRYEEGPSAAHSADRFQSPISGQSTADVTTSRAMTPQYGPGGV
jgi:hypothetical protein